MIRSRLLGLVVLIFWATLSLGCGTSSSSTYAPAGLDAQEQADELGSDDLLQPGEDAVVPGEDAVVPGEDAVVPGEDAAEQDIPGPDIDPQEVPFAVVDTGQDRCFNFFQEITCGDPGSNFFGQDGQYHGFQPKYVDNGDGTVTDLVTGLMWQRDPGVKMTFDEAIAGADAFSLAGYDDWRLPTIKELYSLIDFTGVTGLEAADSIPYIPPVFAFQYGDEAAGERFIDAQYASSTEYVSTTMGGDHTVFGVNFADGRIKGYGTTSPQGGDKKFFVLYVRGAAYGENDFADNGDGTVTDHATGLTWQQSDDGKGRFWEEALADCEALTLGAQDDWRLPSIKELQGIVDYTRSPDTTGSAAIDPIFAATETTDPEGQPNFGYYWSGTTHLDGLDLGSYAAYVAFGRAQGFMEVPPGSENFQLLDVHGAGAQRSDPKVGNPADFPNGHGPQGDVVGILNLVRCVRGGVVFQNVTPTSVIPESEILPPPEGCGNGTCEPGEEDSCFQDCGGEPPNDCGNGTCDPGEEDFCFEDCGGNPPGGPIKCESQADCDAPGGCEEVATMGCICVPDPGGQKRCIPACNTDADCPKLPDLELLCSPEGACFPDFGPPPN